MTCEELTALLSDFLGEELVAECRETVEIHIRGCAKCETYIATIRHTVRITRALPKCNTLPAAFEARMRAILEADLGEGK
jgi:hypothetical protein